MRSKPVLLSLLLVSLLGAAAALGQDAVPVVVAVDSSRSLRPAEIARLKSTLGATLQELPADTPMGLIAFADTPHWLAPVGSSPGEVIAALDSLRPEGRFTALNDALFVAARELDKGGVILLLTDGRDENSATTVEDVARLFEANGVQVQGATVGRFVDEQAMRRLAMLSEGAYLGRIDALDGSRLAASLNQAAAEISARADEAEAEAARLAAEAAPAVAPVRGQVAQEPAGAFANLSWLAPGLLALVVLLSASLLLLTLRRRRSSQRQCRTCGATLEPWESSCSQCERLALEASANGDTVAPTAVPDESLLDPEVFSKSPLPEGLEQTVVLDEQPTLVVRERNRPPRSYTLPRDQVFAVGRAAGVNSLPVNDPAVSGQHFRIVPKEDEFFVVDLETTNGTAVNGEPVRVRKLEPGDTIGAGTTEFVFKMSVRRIS